MKNTTLVIISLFVISFSSYSQDNEMLVQKLKEVYVTELPKSFFVIQANTQMPVFTQAPQIIERLSEIKKNQLCPYIIMIWKDDAGIGKHFDKYLKDNYYIEADAFIKVIISSDLYQMLGERPNTAIHYFYNQNQYKTIDGKHERLNELMPYDLVTMSYDGKHPLKDDNLYHTNQVDYFPINDTIAIELFDGHEDRVRLTNITNGRVLKIFDLTRVNHLELFHRFMNYMNVSEEEIKKNNEYLNQIKRSPLRIDKVYVKDANEIYLIGSAQISYKTKETRYIPADYKKETITIKKGDYITENFSIIIKSDTSFSLGDIKVIDTFENNEYNNNNFVDPAGGFYKSDSTYYFFGYNYCKNEDRTYKQFYKRNKATNFIHTYKDDGSGLMLRQDSKGLATLTRPLGEFYFYNEGMYVFGNKEKVFCTLDLFPEIYEYDQKLSIKMITTDDLKYSFRDNSYDSLTVEQVPYFSFYPGFLMDNSVLALLYRQHNNFYIKLFDSKLSLLQTIDITDQIRLKEEMNSIYYYSNMAFFSDNFLNTTFCNEGGCFNERYRINVEPVNSSYFLNVGAFVR